MQAAGSWSVDACCAVPGNDCDTDTLTGERYCTDHASSSDWLFGLWPGPPQRFEPTGTDTTYQFVGAGYLPAPHTPCPKRAPTYLPTPPNACTK